MDKLNFGKSDRNIPKYYQDQIDKNQKVGGSRVLAMDSDPLNMSENRPKTDVLSQFMYTKTKDDNGMNKELDYSLNFPFSAKKSNKKRRGDEENSNDDDDRVMEHFEDDDE